MKLFLNNLVKGLITALVVICLGGFISLNISVPPSNVMMLVSSSLVNSINTNVIANPVGDGEIDNNKNQEELIKEDKNELLNEDSEDKNNKEELNISNDKQNQVKNEEQKENNNQTNKESNDKVNDNFEVNKEVEIKGNYSPNLEVVGTIEPIATYYGKMTGYGPDCVGCSGITASGMNVMNGNIYYVDKTFGSIRIVAGDKSIPFGSIIKITGINISSDPVIAIVLDRGGMIGFAEGKHAYFDLLHVSEKDTYYFGRQDATFELLRMGY